MKLKKTYLSIALACLSFTNAFAQSSKSDNVVQLKQIVVTADPVVAAVEIDAFSSVSTVVSDVILQDEHAIDLAGALRNTPCEFAAT